jgi:proline iminopeptidase
MDLRRPDPARGGPSRHFGAPAVAAVVSALLWLAPSASRAADASTRADNTSQVASRSYFDTAGRDDVESGGARLIEIDTPRGKFHVWTKRVGNNPRVKVLILHGGPGFTHEAYEALDSYFPAAGIEYYYYDQLGSAYSDQPTDTSLWDLARFVDEVDQVRQALHLDHDNFYLYGHSWGGLLAIEYALEHQEHLKALIISNMMSSVPAYNEYAAKVLMPQMDPHVLAELKSIEAKKDFENPRYESLLMDHFYVEHILRRPAAQWPEPVARSLAHVNRAVYVLMQGPSELGASGRLEHWDRSRDLAQIRVPTLVIGARYDTMDPRHMQWMAQQIPHARYLFCPNGSHFALYDDQKTYVSGLIAFIRDVDAERF